MVIKEMIIKKLKQYTILILFQFNFQYFTPPFAIFIKCFFLSLFLPKYFPLYRAKIVCFLQKMTDHESGRRGWSIA